MSYSERKMVLSGGALSPQVLHEVFELAGTETPQLAIDASPCVSQTSFETKRKTWRTFSELFHFPEPLWLQDEIDEPLSRDRVSAVLDRADALYVMGGASRKAISQWNESGATVDIATRVDEGSLVAAGSSAGAMIWFANGLSDSNSYDVPRGRRWQYEAVEEASMFDAWVMAHHADTDEFGRDKQSLFAAYLQEHRGEWNYAVGIDSYAALVCVDGLAQVRNVTPQSRADWGLRAQVALYTERMTQPYMLSDGDSIPLSEL